LPQVLGLALLLGLLLQEQQAGEDVDVGLDDEGLHRQVDAGQHPAVLEDPAADVLVAGVAEDAVGQDDAHAPAGLEPVDGALDEQDLRRHRRLVAGVVLALGLGEDHDAVPLLPFPG
jgi:hypothetical protein